MIIFFRKLSESWPAKILLGALAISMMSVFGLGSMTSMWGKQDVVLKVGSDAVRTQDLQNAFNQELTRARAMMPGRYLSPAEAIQMGLLNSTVQKQVSDRLKWVMTEDMETIASNDSVRNYIVNNDAFQTMMGQFDRALFDAYLRQLNLSEAGFTANLRQELAQKHVFDAIQSIVAVPSLLRDKMYAYENEARDMSVLLIGPESVKINEKPTEEDLRDYYDAMQDDLYAPEYRTVSVVRITPQTVADSITISDEEVQALFDESKDALSTPERRQVAQILVSDEAKAAEWMNGLTAANFDAVATKAGQSPEETDLGWLTKDSVLAELSIPMFDAQKGAIVGPVESPVGYHILWIKDIEPAKTVQLADVKDELIQKAKAEKTYDLMYQKSKEFDTRIGAGETLETAAAALQLPVETGIVTDASGLDKSGDSVLNNPAAVQSAFMLPQNEVSALIDEGDGYLAVRVDQIEPRTLKSFETVRDVLTAEWMKDKQEKQVQSYADDLYARAEKGDSLQTIALFGGLKVQELKDIKRGDLQSLPPQIGDDLFRAEPDKPLLMPLNEGFVLAEVTGVRMPYAAQDEIGLKTVAQDLNNAITSGLIEETLVYYSNKAGVSVNMPLIEQTFSVYMKPENN